MGSADCVPVTTHSCPQHDFYNEQCSPETPLRCEIGDLSGRLGTIDLGQNPVPRTNWIIRSTTDLEDYTQLYRFTGSVEVHAAGVTSVRGKNQIKVMIPAPAPGTARVFYQFYSPKPR